MGEVNGNLGTEIKSLSTRFESAGFSSVINNNMSAWLKIHAVFVSSIATAIWKENGDSIRLGNNRDSIKIMAKSIREGFYAFLALNIPVRTLI